MRMRINAKTLHHIQKPVKEKMGSKVEENLARKLASNDLPTRTKALKRLKKWIAARSSLENGLSLRDRVYCVVHVGRRGKDCGARHQRRILSASYWHTQKNNLWL